MRKIRSAEPHISLDDYSLVYEAAKYGWKDKMRIYIDKFEKKFSKFIGCKHTLALSNCTNAILLSLQILGIKKGDEVIVPDLTWIASATPITQLGAKPIFVDVDYNTLCIDTNSLIKNITSKTKAIVVVGLLGNLPNWEELYKIKKKYNLKILEDAAECLASKYKNKYTGNFGDISVFSFSGTKLITSGQGGALCTNNKKYFEKAKLLHHHGIDKNKTGKYFWSENIGYNFQWTNIQAALALSQLNKIHKLKKYKNNIFKNYFNKLKDCKSIRLNFIQKESNQCFWITYAIINPKLKISKEFIISEMAKFNIDIRPMFYPLSSMPAFSDYVKNKNYKMYNKNSYEISRYGICLPSGNNLKLKDINLVCKKLIKIISKYE